jgi:hypothetical protein
VRAFVFDALLLSRFVFPLTIAIADPPPFLLLWCCVATHFLLPLLKVFFWGLWCSGGDRKEKNSS